MIKLTPEEKQKIQELQYRKKMVGCYGDDSGVRSEQKDIQRVINNIKNNAKLRADGQPTEKINTSVPWNVNLI